MGGRGVVGRGVGLCPFRFHAGAGFWGLGQGRQLRVDPGGAVGSLFWFVGGIDLIGRMEMCIRDSP